MGGRLSIHLAGLDDPARAARVARRVAARIGRWSSRLTRHDPASELSRLNADSAPEVAVGPTLTAALQAGALAVTATDGLVSLSLLDARLAAEGLKTGVAGPGHDREQWSLRIGRRRGGAFVRRPPGLRLDLDGIGKGWIADRALELLGEWPSAVVDADGDLAGRTAPGERWEVAIDDPREGRGDGAMAAILQLPAPAGGVPFRWGVATSGTSVHRWTVGGETRHHLIDPRTGRPARTDVVQATVVAGCALRAETLAKAAVIAGSADGFALLERARVYGAVLLLADGDALALPWTQPFLAPGQSAGRA